MNLHFISKRAELLICFYIFSIHEKHINKSRAIFDKSSTQEGYFYLIEAVQSVQKVKKTRSSRREKENFFFIYGLSIILFKGRDKIKGQSGKNIILTSTKILPKK